MQQYSRFHSTIGGMITWFATGSLLQDLMWEVYGVPVGALTSSDVLLSQLAPLASFPSDGNQRWVRSREVEWD